VSENEKAPLKKQETRDFYLIIIFFFLPFAGFARLKCQNVLFFWVLSTSFE
jgi:hypothetical protein